MAAWVQAAGSILAILGALLVVRHGHKLQQKAAAKDRTLQARALILSMLPGLYELRAALAQRVKHVELMLAPIPHQDWDDALKRVYIDVPPPVAGAADRMYMLGEPLADDLLIALAIISHHNRGINRWREEAQAKYPLPKDLAGPLEKLEADALRRIESAIKIIERMETIVPQTASVDGA